MRLLARFGVALAFALALATSASAAMLEVGKDRAGGDYASIPGILNASQCASTCDSQGACKAFTWVQAGVQGPQPICYLKNSIPTQTANSCCTSGVKFSGPIPAGASVGKDRPGGDYNSFNIGGATPSSCASACAGDPACKAWTYVSPGIQGPSGRCYEKNVVPAEVANSCCISGLGAGPPLPPGAQANKDRPGSDYSATNLASADPSLCFNACQADGNCAAWTYVNPGVQGPQAKCYLKNPAPAATSNPCCISGVHAIPPTPPGAQVGKDRPGSDYSATNLASADPNLCYNACQSDGSCAAWTYVKPGVQGPQAKCYLKNPAPAATNNPCCISGVKLGPPLPPGAQAGKDRPGSDYSATNLASADPNLCFNACQSDGSCAAWTYVKPGVQGPQAKCYLKNPSPAATNNPCCISGVKLGPPLPPGAQAGKDRPGSDYSATNLASADPNLCYNACQSDGSCAAWTYVKPGVQGPQAKCYLKDPAPAATNNPCCISGVKLGPALPPGAQLGKDRPGSDYASNFLPSADPNLCYNACQSDGSCAAWTYVKPGVQGPQAKCYLKNPAPAPASNPCCISGLRSGPPPPPPSSGGGPFEVNVNRPGGDYLDFASGGKTVFLCLAACATQPACKAWTYVKPGIQGPQSHCWLKSYVPPSVVDNCCTSGVK